MSEIVRFKNMYAVDLTDGPAIVQLNQMFMGDVLANRIGAYVTNNGESVSLSGTVSGTALLYDGSTVPMTGTVSGNMAYIDLLPGAYSVPGPIQVTVKFTASGVTTTLVEGFGNVKQTESGTVIDPGTIIPSVSALIAAIDAAVESIPQDYSVLSANMDALTHVDLTESGYISGTGAEVANSDYRRTGYIPVSGDSVLILDGFYVGSTAGSAYAYYFYTADKTPISGANSITSRTVVTTIPSTAAYVRFSSRTSQGETPVAYVSNHVVEDVADLMPRMAAAEADVADLKSAINNIVTIETSTAVNKYNKDAVQAGYWNVSDGVTLVSNDNFRACETYIPVIGGTTYKTWWVNGTTVEENSWNYVAWYDSSKTFISGSSISTSSVTAPSNASFVRFTAQKNKHQTFMALASDVTPTEYIPYNTISTITLNQNIIIPQLAGLSALKNVKIDVIGDSWSAINDTASVKYTDLLMSVDGADVNVVAYSGAGFHKPTSGNKPFYTQALSVRSTADIVLVFGSFNDVSDIVDGTEIGEVTDTETTTICGCINTTINNIVSLNPSAKIVFVTPGAWRGYNANNDNNNANNPTALAYVQAIKDVCFKRGYECKDALRSMNLKPWIASFREAYQPDGTHPNNAGHLRYVYPVIKNYLLTIV